MGIKTLKIKEDVHKQLKEYCDDNMLKMNLLIEKIIRDYLEKNKNMK